MTALTRAQTRLASGRNIADKTTGGVFQPQAVYAALRASTFSRSSAL